MAARQILRTMGEIRQQCEFDNIAFCNQLLMQTFHDESAPSKAIAATHMNTRTCNARAKRDLYNVSRGAVADGKEDKACIDNGIRYKGTLVLIHVT